MGEAGLRQTVQVLKGLPGKTCKFYSAIGSGAGRPQGENSGRRTLGKISLMMVGEGGWRSERGRWGIQLGGDSSHRSTR